MTLADAKYLANEYIGRLEVYCQRVEVAGSVRRQVKRVGDVELCAIPDPTKIMGLAQLVNNLPRTKGKVPGKYVQLIHTENTYRTLDKRDAPRIDLFFCTPETWGLNFAIRTGSAEFTHGLLKRANQLGYHSEEAQLRDEDGKIIPTPKEEDVFEVLGLEWVEPRHRHGMEQIRKALKVERGSGVRGTDNP